MSGFDYGQTTSASDRAHPKSRPEAVRTGSQEHTHHYLLPQGIHPSEAQYEAILSRLEVATDPAYLDRDSISESDGYMVFQLKSDDLVQEGMWNKICRNIDRAVRHVL